MVNMLKINGQLVNW